MADTTLDLIVSPSRLFAAADTLLRAIRSPSGFDSRIPVYIGPVRLGASACPTSFTPDELVEALTILTLMGLVPTDRFGRPRRPRSLLRKSPQTG